MCSSELLTSEGRRLYLEHIENNKEQNHPVFLSLFWTYVYLLDLKNLQYIKPLFPLIILNMHHLLGTKVKVNH